MPHQPTQPPRLIALDLDGTLLNTSKEISPADAAALSQAAAQGIHIVPATGRFYDAMPDAVKALPFVRYVITINGAAVLDRLTGEVLSRAELPWQQAVAIMEYFDTLPVLYDCYMDGAAWMRAAQKPLIDSYAASPFIRSMWHTLRRPVPELKELLRQTRHGVQKTTCIFRDGTLRERLLAELPRMFDGIAVTTSYENSVEVNQAAANKGDALRALAAHLGIDMALTAAFGDDRNDISMLEAAGCGIAMGNAAPDVQAHADLVTLDCDSGGVAAAIGRLLG